MSESTPDVLERTVEVRSPLSDLELKSMSPEEINSLPVTPDKKREYLARKKAALLAGIPRKRDTDSDKFATKATRKYDLHTSNMFDASFANAAIAKTAYDQMGLFLDQHPTTPAVHLRQEGKQIFLSSQKNLPEIFIRELQSKIR